MNISPLLLRQAIRLLLMVYIAIIGVADALAIPKRVKVRLFESAPNTASALELKGGFNLLEPHMIFPPAPYRISSEKNCLKITNLRSSKEMLLRTNSIALESSGKGLILRCGSGASRLYDGLISCQVNKSGSLTVHDTLSNFQYVTSVVGSESLSVFSPEVLKAQAVLVQTRLLKQSENATIGDSTQNQAFFGAEYARPEVERAVRAVWGQVLCFNRQPAVVYYHSTCAGKTSSAREIFGPAAGDLPYLKGVRCQFCEQSPFYKSTISQVPLSSFVSRFGALPVVDKVDWDNRPIALTFRVNNRQIDRSGYEFWIDVGQKFGWDKVPGTRYRVKQVGDYVQFESLGAGHGVGMCQWGAFGQAKSGKKYRDILSFYYPGTTVEHLF